MIDDLRVYNRKLTDAEVENFRRRKFSVVEVPEQESAAE